MTWLLATVAGVAHAQLELTLDSPSLTVGIGGAAAFTGTIANPAGQPTLFLNGLDISVEGGLLIDPAPFGLPVSLAGGESFNGTLFDVAVPGGTMPGLYAGNLTIVGGADGNATDPLTPAIPFTVNVVAASAAPEPAAATLLLLCTGFSACGLARRHRRSWEAESWERDGEGILKPRSTFEPSAKEPIQ
jgi:hypothetical protein